MVAFGQTGSDYELNWSTIDGGGGRSSGGPFTLTGSISQPDAGYSSGGEFEVLGGFFGAGQLCIVEFDDFARFAQYWLHPSCNLSNDFCYGADLDEIDGVNFVDLGLFIDYWLSYCPQH